MMHRVISHTVKLQPPVSAFLDEVLHVHARVVQSLAFEARTDGEVEEAERLVLPTHEAARHAVEVLDLSAAVRLIGMMSQSLLRLLLSQCDGDLVAGGKIHRP